jgi:hypothetical protein
MKDILQLENPERYIPKHVAGYSKTCAAWNEKLSSREAIETIQQQNYIKVVSALKHHLLKSKPRYT